jgi:hypothetical protein
MAIDDVFLMFKDVDLIQPRAFYANRNFNGTGTSLNYYINGIDSQGYDAGLKLDFFHRVRFTNFKKPHPTKKHDPYFDKFINPFFPFFCSYDEFDRQEFTPATMEMIDLMAKHWSTPVEKFANTLLFAGELLWDAEDDNWLGHSLWEGGNFIGTLPSPKRRSRNLS